MDRKKGGTERSAESKALDVHYENLEQFKEWLKEHPVEIPKEIEAQILESKTELDSPSLEFERWKEILEDSRESALRAKDPNGPAEDKYRRLSFLREVPRASKQELFLLESALADCFCGSGKKFNKCHGN